MKSKFRGKLLEVHFDGPNRLGLVAFADKHRTIYLDFVPDAKPGDYVWFYAAVATEHEQSEEPVSAVRLSDEKVRHAAS
jgi:hypothetical protein